ncbi:unnamed protein product [Ranitomeya imitator]|uniref:Carbohydrate kinase FGGY C-terminal domain-containing protein n=1 Tax=Ranitomeya imitator TaxID=111125 RepID=A0ABN9LI15_9NEOB|nr:unnamed protein product [Ranitomeya imitator]
MGLKPSTTKCHLVRAILESVAFRNRQLYDTMQRETSIRISKIRADGGVSNNTFVMQMTADLFGQAIDKPKHTDMSALGAAFLAGLAVASSEDVPMRTLLPPAFVPREPLRNYPDDLAVSGNFAMPQQTTEGVWSTKEELKKLRHQEVLYEPQRKIKDYEVSMSAWELALQRCSNWYNDS